MRDAKDKGCCSRITEQIFKFFLICSMLALLGFFWIQHSMQGDKYLISPEKKDIFRAMMKFFVILFIILYLIMSAQVFMKYREKRKICSLTNCIFSSCSLLMLYFCFWIGENIREDKVKYFKDFNKTCFAIENTLDNTSVFQEADQIVSRASSLICSTACPCMFKGNRLL